jgi:hypothetical protein
MKNSGTLNKYFYIRVRYRIYGLLSHRFGYVIIIEYKLKDNIQDLFQY